MREVVNFLCLACGAPLPAVLRRAAALRCHDCIDDDAPLRADLVDPDARV
jgi:hypothetical protein